MTVEQANGHASPKLAPVPSQWPAADAADLDVPEFVRQDQAARADTAATAAEQQPQDGSEWPQTDAVPEEYRKQAEAVPEVVVEQDEDDEGSQRFRRVRVVVEHRSTRATARQVMYVSTGVLVAARRRRDEKSTARHQRMLRAAEAAGDHQSALEWEERAARHRRERHARRVHMLRHGVADLVRTVAVAGAATAGFLVVLGVMLAVNEKDPAQLIRPLMDAVAFTKFAFDVAAAIWGPLLDLAFVAALVALWHTGREHARTTNSGWAARLLPADAQANVIVTADGIVQALQHLGLPKLNTAFKNNWAPKFITTPIREGSGYRAVFELPLGVTPGEIADKRELFARNLYRAPIEVWVTDAVQAGTGTAGVVDLWVADRGVLNKPAPEYPLLHEGMADVFAGVPAGVSPRGQELLVPLVGNNGVFGGMMGQGKSNACRVVMLGCALDPLAELRVYVFAGNGDFDAYAPRLSRYERGATDEVTAAGLASLQELYEEVGRRETRLAELGAKKVTRQIAEQHSDLRPIIALYSECHELFGHKDMGEEAAEFAVQTIRRARKTAITLLFDTQSSRKEAIPPKIVELVSVNACFAVKSWRSNDGFLGDGSFAAGIRATELRPGRDRGTSLATGVSDEQFEIMKWYFIAVDDDRGFDAASEVIARALAGVATGTQVKANAKAAPVVEVRDLLDDLVEVLTGSASLPIADVPPLLRALAPKWKPYSNLSGVALRETLLDEYGIKVPSTGNRYPLDPEAVRKAHAARRPGPAGNA